MIGNRPGRLLAGVGIAAVAALGITACTNSGTSTTGSSSAGSSDTAAATSASSNNTAAEQQVESQPPSSGASASSGCTYTKYGATKLDLKNTTVGFSQSESTSNPFRATETKSIQDEAKRLGIKLIERNANANVAQQNTDIEAMIAQGAKVLIVAPENSSGLAAAFSKAKAAHVPILTIDRTVTGTACSDFIGFIGSNFAGQAKISADDLGTALGGKGKVAILQGTPGNNVATARTDGFTAQIKAKYPGISVVASQTANFDQATGQKVMAQILQSNPGITGVYAENDTMALGAIQAMKQAGKTPGKDIKVVAIDGTSDCVKLVANGQMVADVETNPRFGPLAFKALQNFYGSGTPSNIIIKDHHFTKDNAAKALSDGDVY